MRKATSMNPNMIKTKTLSQSVTAPQPSIQECYERMENVSRTIDEQLAQLEAKSQDEGSQLTAVVQQLREKIADLEQRNVELEQDNRDLQQLCQQIEPDLHYRQLLQRER